MRKVYVQELQNLLDKFILSAGLTKESVSQLILAFNQGDVEEAEELIKQNDKIYAQLRDIERASHLLIALQQPVAADLRLIFTIINSSSDLAGMLGHLSAIAKGIVRHRLDLAAHGDLLLIINDMFNQVEMMLEETIPLFANPDVQRASELAMEDKSVDEGLSQLYTMGSRRMAEGGEAVQVGIYLIDVASSLERIGDYITNLCEHIVFLDTGQLMTLN